MRRLNLTGKHASSITPAPGPEYPGLGNVGQSNLLSWAGTFGQGLTSLTKGKPLWPSLEILKRVPCFATQLKRLSIQLENTGTQEGDMIAHSATS